MNYFYQTKGTETVLLLSEQIFKETTHKDAGWRQSCGGPCIALRKLLNCFIRYITIRWARRLLPHEVSHLSVSHSAMLVLFRNFQLCHDQNFPPLATDGSQPFIVHTWQAKACLLFCHYVAVIVNRIWDYTERWEEGESGAVGFAVSSFGVKTLLQDKPPVWNRNIRCRVHKNLRLVQILSDVNTAHACLPRFCGGC